MWAGLWGCKHFAPHQCYESLCCCFVADQHVLMCRPQWAIYTAVFLCHHYFAKRSMKRSDRYVGTSFCTATMSYASLEQTSSSLSTGTCPGPMAAKDKKCFEFNSGLHCGCVVLTVLLLFAVLQLVATACLYLACKVQESPKYLRDVIKEAERKKWERYVKDHPGELRKWDDAVSA